MASLSIINNFSLPVQGNTLTGKQAAATDDFSDAFAMTVTGTAHCRTGSIATATYNTIYDSSNDLPATFLYAHFWADQIMYLQMIGSATNAIVKLAAYTPFVIPGYGSILGAASTTAMSSEPTVTAIAKIVIGNTSGSTANYTLAVIL